MKTSKHETTILPAGMYRIAFGDKGERSQVKLNHWWGYQTILSESIDLAGPLTITRCDSPSRDRKRRLKGG